MLGKRATTMLIVAFASVVPTTSHAAPLQCAVSDQQTFAGDGEDVRLGRLKGLPQTSNFAVFSAPLAVNTDGAPTSYHPDDYLGKSLAINRLDHGITISPTKSDNEEIAVFNEWRSSGWKVPAGYSISWKNVIAQTAGGTPCIFSTGEYEGYFGSLTALKNDLPASKKGECEVNDQLDQRYIPAIVLRGDKNAPLRKFGADTGDLVLAINPDTGAVVPAIIGDTGNGSRIGEGSVALNMSLLGKTKQPKTYGGALSLDTGDVSMVIAVLPGSKLFEPEKPFSVQNITKRLESWADDHGYGSLDGLRDAARACATGL